MLTRHCFDFLQFDSEAADFPLAVNASEEFDAAVRQPARAVSGAVQARARLVAERIGKVLLRRQLRAIQITPCQPVAAGVQFAGNPDWRGLQMLVQDVNLRVRDGPADGNGSIGRQRRGDSMAAGESRVLRWPITVDQLRAVQL